LSGADAEAHSVAENDRQEVCQCVRDDRQAHEDDGETPHFEVKAGANELLEAERLGGGVASVGVDSPDDDAISLALRKRHELAALGESGKVTRKT